MTTNGNNLLLERDSLGEKAAARLRQLILDEFLKPGQPIVERDLTAQLGISRTPLREALQTLVIEGLIDVAANRRATVANPSLTEIRDFLAVLAALEGLAGELACTQATSTEMTIIAAYHHQMQMVNREGRTLQYFQLNLDFHQAIVNASHNSALIRTHSTYNARLYRIRYLSSRRKKRRDAAVDSHGTIVQALEGRQVDLAGNLLREHLMQAQRNIEEAWREQTAEEYEATSSGQ